MRKIILHDFYRDSHLGPLDLGSLALRAILAWDDSGAYVLYKRRMGDYLYYVYILASRRNGTLYIGVSNDILRRTWEHKNDLVAGFTKKYGVHILVWYEIHNDIDTAISREKRLKRWNRDWKIALIEKTNSGWNDLYERLLGEIALPDIPGSP